MVIKKIVEFFTSLKLTAALLAFATVLVFVGTIAQADEGLYGAQAHYFKQWLVIGAHLFGHKIPLILPGGYLIGTLLLVNLVVSHIYRFEFSFKKMGIQLAHAGIILLLVGQLSTDLLSHELQLHFVEGETRSYSESATDYEIIFMNGKTVTAFAAKGLKPGEELKSPSLPFTVRVKKFWKNSDISFRAPMMKNAPALASNGLALNFDFHLVPDAKTMDQRNLPTAVIELIGPQGSLGDWVVSDWMGDASLVQAVQDGYAGQLGAAMAHKIASQLAIPQSLEINGQKISFTMRPAQLRQPFSLTLLKATHTTYPGTDIPKDFRSRVRLENSATGEKREVEISMNHPLRYGGLTFYQYQMSAGEVVNRMGKTPSSVLSVVRNPSWLTPYIGCGIVGLGLTVQFMFHLLGFISKQKKK
jgi:hypothetical protein